MLRNRLPVGVGSRGGTFDLDRPAYYRSWRKSHPEYVARDNERLRLRRAKIADQCPMPAVSDAALAILREEVEASSQRAVAKKILLDHGTVSRLVRGERVMGSEAIDAIVFTYGFDRLINTMRRLRKEARHHRGAADK